MHYKYWYTFGEYKLIICDRHQRPKQNDNFILEII